MDVGLYKEKTTEIVVNPMIEFLEEWGGEDYTKEDVSKCEQLVHTYLEALGAMSDPTNDAIMDCVKKAVLALNQLNEDTDYSMIETEERENIWELIQTSAVECGLQDPSDDITEEWREW